MNLPLCFLEYTKQPFDTGFLMAVSPAKRKYTVVTACYLQNQSCLPEFPSPTGACSCSFVHINWALQQCTQLSLSVSILSSTACCSDDTNFRSIYILYFIMITENITNLNIAIWHC